MQFDWPLDQLQTYAGGGGEPADFDVFWAQTLRLSRAKVQPAQVAPVASPFDRVDIRDVHFSGWNGEPISAWLRYPRGLDQAMPGIVVYQGYGGGRGFAFDNLAWAAAGYAVLNVDTRGQGASWGFGDTPDQGATGPAVPGWMTRGILDPAGYYYRRLMTDCVLAFDWLAAQPMVDPARVGVMGTSQGGGLAVAVAGLVPTVAACAARVPFLSDYRRATVVTDEYPYQEITDYLATHRLDEAQVFATLAYFDAVNFAKRATAPLDISTGLADRIVPPSTVFALYNNYAGVDKAMTVWPYNGHEGGGNEDDLRAMRFFARVLGGRDF